ncbi:E1 ubiquitin-activating protein uba2 [Geranomyces variabilis]|nr:E1 ubiquitin-activating protein uba2 [Geranomyces variabilis]
MPSGGRGPTSADPSTARPLPARQVVAARPVSETVRNARVLVVGAGGIGCELLKDLVKSGFQDIHIVDMDTIDLSNLNRQFLFQEKHVGKQKALVARKSALQFNPNAKIVALNTNIITNKNLDFWWYDEFDLVLNALDNYEARHHVNGMCLATNTPLVESGTEGFNGQVQVHMKPYTRCFDCDGRPNRKTYPVCTIRSTPSAPIHCIVWAKDYLFNELFGNPEDVGDTIDEEHGSENANEMEHLRREKKSFQRIREAAGTEDYGRLVFEKVFTQDVEALLEMPELWKNRPRPTPLNYAEAKGDASTTNAPVDELKYDHEIWSLQENTRVLLESVQNSVNRLHAMRASKGPSCVLQFDKDDEIALNFVTATANLRAAVYGLEQKSRFEVKEIAGNIIPAVATTNAIVAALIVNTAKKGLEEGWEKCINSWVTRTVHTEIPQPKSQKDEETNPCAVCSVDSINVTVNVHGTTFGEFLTFLKAFPTSNSDGLELEGMLTVMEGGRMIYDEEDEDDELAGVTLAGLSIKPGSTVEVVNGVKKALVRIWGGWGPPCRLASTKAERRRQRQEQRQLLQQQQQQGSGSTTLTAALRGVKLAKKKDTKKRNRGPRPSRPAPPSPPAPPADSL